MKKKVLIVAGIILAILVVAGLVTSYADSARVRNGVEPKFTIKIISEDGNKVTYWGFGYKVVLYPSVSPNEPYKNNRGVKYGSWFMKYELEEEKDNNEEHHFEAKVIEVHDGYIIVEPSENEEERKSSDKFYIENKNNVNYKKSQILAITYVGGINESYPAQIGVTNISIIKSN